MRSSSTVLTLAAVFLLTSSLSAGTTAAGVLRSVGQQDTSNVRSAQAGTTPDAVDHSTPVTGGVIKCVNGRAKGHDCHNVDLVSFLPWTALGATEPLMDRSPPRRLYGMWGWTDPTTGREFAVVGLTGGTSFVEVTDPATPEYLGTLPRPPGTGLTDNRDIKVYRNHAFIIAWAAGPSGVQVFDLTQLREVRNAPVTFQETARYDRVDNVHTLALNEATGYAYATYTDGEQGCGGGLHIIDVRIPTKPIFAGCYAEPPGGVHETQCVVYRGPDQQYQDRELCFNANQGAGINIADVTDKQQPKTIGTATYPDIAYAHQGWLSEDQRYFFLGDELDEGASATPRTRTLVFDVSDVDEPVLVTEFFATTGATDHTLFVRGSYAYQGIYRGGFRVLDVADPKNLKVAGYFDTFPDDGPDPAAFGGTHDLFAYFKEDGLAAVNHTSDGLFLLRCHR